MIGILSTSLLKGQEKSQKDANIQNLDKDQKLYARNHGENKKQENHLNVQHTRNEDTGKIRSKKRKVREDDIEKQQPKILKENSFDKVPRLPPSLLMKLDDKPQKVAPIKKVKAIATTQFTVEEAKKRKNKPSKYLEESIYLNDDEDSQEKKEKKRIDKPNVLPSIPTASTSSSGYTSNFVVNVLPNEIKFVAQSNSASNFRENYLYSNRIRRLGTHNLYKRQRSAKMSKF